MTASRDLTEASKGNAVSWKGYCVLASLCVLILASIGAGTFSANMTRRDGSDGKPVRVVQGGAAAWHPLTPRDSPPLQTSVGQHLMAEAPPIVTQKHAAIAAGIANDALAARTLAVGERSLGTAMSLRFHDLSSTCTRGACELRGLADGDEVRTRLAMRENGFLDAINAAGCTTETDIVVPSEEHSEFIAFLDCEK